MKKYIEPIVVALTVVGFIVAWKFRDSDVGKFSIPLEPEVPIHVAVGRADTHNLVPLAAVSASESNIMEVVVRDVVLK